MSELEKQIEQVENDLYSLKEDLYDKYNTLAVGLDRQVKKLAGRIDQLESNLDRYIEGQEELLNKIHHSQSEHREIIESSLALAKAMRGYKAVSANNAHTKAGEVARKWRYASYLKEIAEKYLLGKIEVPSKYTTHNMRIDYLQGYLDSLEREYIDYKTWCRIEEHVVWSMINDKQDD